MAKSAPKTCLECGGKISGRADKKFCSDACRIDYNNRLNSDANRFVKNVNNSLRKNRRILQSLNTTGKSKVKREKLVEKGFDFDHFTSIYKTKEGALYHFCYEHGYLQTDKDWFLLVVKNLSEK